MRQAPQFVVGGYGPGRPGLLGVDVEGGDDLRRGEVVGDEGPAVGVPAEELIAQLGDLGGTAGEIIGHDGRDEDRVARALDIVGGDDRGHRLDHVDLAHPLVQLGQAIEELGLEHGAVLPLQPDQDGHLAAEDLGDPRDGDARGVVLGHEAEVIVVQPGPRELDGEEGGNQADDRDDQAGPLEEPFHGPSLPKRASARRDRRPCRPGRAGVSRRARGAGRGSS